MNRSMLMRLLIAVTSGLLLADTVLAVVLFRSRNCGTGDEAGTTGIEAGTADVRSSIDRKVVVPATNVEEWQSDEKTIGTREQEIRKPHFIRWIHKSLEHDVERRYGFLLDSMNLDVPRQRAIEAVLSRRVLFPKGEIVPPLERIQMLRSVEPTSDTDAELESIVGKTGGAKFRAFERNKFFYDDLYQAENRLAATGQLLSPNQKTELIRRAAHLESSSGDGRLAADAWGRIAKEVLSEPQYKTYLESRELQLAHQRYEAVYLAVFQESEK